jgi:phosphomethylpyrimidine synthase
MFCSMKITHDVRDFATKQNAPLENSIAVEEAEKGTVEVSERTAPAERSLHRRG